MRQARRTLLIAALVQFIGFPALAADPDRDQTKPTPRQENTSGLAQTEFRIGQTWIPETSARGLSVVLTPEDNARFAALCAQVEKPEQVISLSLSRVRLPITGLEPIRKFTRLQQLKLDHSWLGIQGFQNLGQLTELQELDLTGATIADDWPRVLADLKQLRRLRVGGLINDASLRQLPVLPELQSLDLSHSDVTSAGLDLLSRQPRLTALHLMHQEISAAGIESIAKLPELKCLLLQGARIDAKALAPLAKAPKLTTLNLSGCSAIDDEALKHIGKIHTLTTLYLNNTAITDAGLLELRGLDNLSSLSILAPRVTSRAVGRLKAMPTLLHLSHAPVSLSEGGIEFTPQSTGVKPLLETPDGRVIVKIEKDTEGGPVSSSDDCGWGKVIVKIEEAKERRIARLFDKPSGKAFGLPMYQTSVFTEYDTLPVLCWAFSPDGKYVATGAGSGPHDDRNFEATNVGDIRVWDAKTGEFLATVRGSLGKVKRVAFREDSKTVEYTALRYNIDGP
ncbi:MAG: hypothetical protein K8T91_18065 [Planctomycetes bacterium]|nr:hypothetical protein [Planctomycetota bacterium]